MSTTTATAYKPTDLMHDLSDIVKGFNIIYALPSYKIDVDPNPEDTINVKKGDTFNIDYTHHVEQGWSIPTTELIWIETEASPIDDVRVEVKVIPGGAKWVNGRYIATYQLEEVEWA